MRDITEYRYHRQTFIVRMRQCAMLVGLLSLAGTTHSEVVDKSAPSTSSFNVRNYVHYKVIRGLASQQNMSDANPGYAGYDVHADILPDSTETVTHLFVTGSSCMPALTATSAPAEKCVIVNRDYYIAAVNAGDHKTISEGLITGVLVIPFKYHFSDHATTSGSTLGGYIGYEKYWSLFGSAAVVLGGGLAFIPTSTTTTNFNSTATVPATTASSTTTSDSSLHGITLATGLIGKIGMTNAQFGILVGVDLVNKNINYKYDGKPWLSFSFAYAFDAK